MDLAFGDDLRNGHVFRQVGACLQGRPTLEGAWCHAVEDLPPSGPSRPQTEQRSGSRVPGRASTLCHGCRLPPSTAIELQTPSWYTLEDGPRQEQADAMDDLLRHGLTLQGAEVRVLAYLVEHTYGSVLEGARTPRLTAHLLRQAREGALWLWPDLPVAFANAEETEAASELPPVQVSLLLERPATSHREAPSRMILVVHLEYQSSPHDGERLREACRDAPWQGRVLGAD